MKILWYSFAAALILQSCYSGINCDPVEPLRFILNNKLDNYGEPCDTMYINPEVELQIGQYTTKIVGIENLVIYIRGGFLTAYDLEAQNFSWTLRMNDMFDLNDIQIQHGSLYVKSRYSVKEIALESGQVVNTFSFGVPIHGWDVNDTHVYAVALNGYSRKHYDVIRIDRQTGIKEVVRSETSPDDVGIADFFVYRAADHTTNCMIVENHFNHDQILFVNLNFTSGAFTKIDEMSVKTHLFNAIGTGNVAFYSDGKTIKAYRKSDGKRIWQLREVHRFIDASGELLRLVNSDRDGNTTLINPQSGRVIAENVNTHSGPDTYITFDNYLITTYLGEMSVYEIRYDLTEVWTDYLPYSCKTNKESATSNLLVNKELSLITYVTQETLISIPINL